LSFPVPTWGHIDAFCAADGWEQTRSTDHVVWEKVLPSGEFLHTHRSFSASDEIGAGLFGMILRDQLRVSREQFWRAVQAGEPVDRPMELDDSPATYEAWVFQGLLSRGFSEEQIRELDPDEAKVKLQELWSQPKS
jgi:hypothetical protein